MNFGFCSNAFPAYHLEDLINHELPIFSDISNHIQSENFAIDLQLGRGVLEKFPKEGAYFLEKINKHRLLIGSFNLYPLCDFQAPVVKTKVYHPNWYDEKRFELTLIGAQFVANFLKPTKAFTISTLAGSFHEDASPSENDFAQQATIYSRFALELSKIKAETGVHIILALEPEPFTTLQRTDDILRLWQHFDDETCYEHLGINIDCCHFSIMNEHPLEAYTLCHKHNIRVPKIHASTALKVKAPFTDDKIELLKEMAEPRFLHQSTLISKQGIQHFSDLPFTFNQLENVDTVLSHYHMPLFLNQEYSHFSTSYKDTEELIHALPQDNSPDIYIETYTWSVMTQQFAKDTVEGITEEILFLKNLLQSRVKS